MTNSKTITMGTGGHTYRWVDNWAKLPAGKKFGYTHSVAEDAQGRIHIHNTSADSVAVFDADGKFIRSWGGDLFEGSAHGMQYNKEADGEFFYFADPGRHRVIKTTLDGKVLFQLELPKESGVYEKPEKYKPTNIAIASNGDFYVADGYGLFYIHQYDKNARYIRTIGKPGAGPGEFACPHGLTIDSRSGRPLLLVADRQNVRLQYLTLDGKPLSVVDHDLLYPCHFDIRGTDLLIPDLYGRLTIFDKDNRLVTHLGENPGIEKAAGWPNVPHEQRLAGRFNSPHMAIWDRSGNIFCVEWIPDGRVTKLQRVG
jgi:hypothetical protein